MSGAAPRPREEGPIVYRFGLGEQALAALTRWAARTPEGVGITIPHAGLHLALSLSRPGLAHMHPDGEGGWRVVFTGLGNQAAHELLVDARRSYAESMELNAHLSRAPYPPHEPSSYWATEPSSSSTPSISSSMSNASAWSEAGSQSA
ncbi:MAG: hypothetical protein JWN67_5056 [Actinomycetia bacterium]|nr:hypothetical protein [Actinomycetes bacterium]